MKPPNAIDCSILIPGIRLVIPGRDAQRIEITRGILTTVIGRKYDQCVVQAYALIDCSKQLRQRAIELQKVIFALQAGRAEDIAATGILIFLRPI